MYWEAIAAIGQAVGALALVFVLIQVRHARQEVRRSVSQARADVARELWVLGTENAQLSGLLGRTETALSGQQPPFVTELVATANITPEEAMQVLSHEWAWWMYRAQVIRFARELQVAERAQFDESVRFVYGNLNVGRLWLQLHRHRLDPDAVRYVDNLLAQPG